MENSVQSHAGTDMYGWVPGRNLTFFGIVTMILGVLAIGSPLITGLAVAVSVGVLLVAFGIIRIVDAVRTGKWGPGILGSLLGVLAIVAGAIMLSRPAGAALSLTLVLAFYLFAHGIALVVAAFRMRPLTGWGWSLFNAIITVLLGVMIWRQWPISGAWALGVLLGVHIFTSGATMLATGLAVRKVANAAAGSANPAPDAT